MFRETLEAILDPRHELLELGRRIDWAKLDQACGETFVDQVGRPGLEPALVGMEACASARYVGRTLSEMGHDARLMPAQYVKPYAGAQKNDFADAEAIAEAVQRPRMRFVPIKSRERLELQAVHRERDRLVSRRTAVGNRIRGLLVEHGIVMRKGRGGFRGFAPALLDDPDAPLSPTVHRPIAALWAEWLATDRAVHDLTRQLEELAKRAESAGVR